MKSRRLLVLVFVSYFALGIKSGFAAADEYDDSQSHPLRVVAYLVHPAAFLLEWTLARPFHWLVSATPEQEALFGHTPHPPVIAAPQPIQTYGAAKKVPLKDIPSVEPQGVTNPVPAPQP